MFLFRFREISRHVQHIFVALCTLVPAMNSLKCRHCEPDPKNRTIQKCYEDGTPCLSCFSYTDRIINQKNKWKTFPMCIQFPKIPKIHPIGGKKQCHESTLYGDGGTVKDPIVVNTKFCSCFTDGCNAGDIEFQPKKGKYKYPMGCYCDEDNFCPDKSKCRTCLNIITKDGRAGYNCFPHLENFLFSSDPNNCIPVKYQGKDASVCGCSTDYCNSLEHALDVHKHIYGSGNDNKNGNNDNKNGNDHFDNDDPPGPRSLGSIQRSSLPAEILCGILSALWLLAAY